MKRKVLLAVLALVMIFSVVLAACTESFDAVLPTDVPAKAQTPTLMLHYKRKIIEDYTKWGFWIWVQGGNGALYKLNYQDSFGGIALYPLSDFGAAETDTIGIIPRMHSDWTKDVDADRMLDLSTLQKDSNNYIHVYLQQGDVNLYKDIESMNYTVSAKFSGTDKIVVEASSELKHIKVLENDTVLADVKLESKEKYTYTFDGANKADSEKNYSVEVVFVKGNRKVTLPVNTQPLRQAYFDSAEFNSKYYFDGELGAIYSPTETVFRVWSPVSTKILLNIYNYGDGNETPETYEMTKGEKGVFEHSLSGKDYAGKYYTYTVYNSSYTSGVEIVDPYAKSAGLNGTRGMIVDFSATDPMGWDAVSPVAYDRKELVVWETHVADVTSSKTWTGTEANRKKFLGLIESGTTYTAGGVTVSTGFDHIKELGVNAVQLVPIFDQANSESNVQFNWGYNPLNYNVLEGAYSSNPSDGYTRISEFKQVVKAFNAEGINIIMDVVYNHVSSAMGSNFDVLMPGYYFRYNSDGGFSNGSGCGNETASSRSMFRKFMIDSVCFWAKEYKLGGFRFDLMGLHDIETMNLLVEALKEINPNIVVYGEPWTGGDTPLPTGQQAVQDNGGKFKGYGQFNDQMRDALIKGGLNPEGSLGWVSDEVSVNRLDLNKIVMGLKGATKSFLSDPNKSVNYATCHDNYTLCDRMKAAGVKNDETVKKMAMLANSVVFTSNGTTFMLAGEEFLRTKGGDHNSYESSYEVNELNYALKIANIDMFQNYQKLIALKKSCSGLHLNADEIEGNYTVTTESDGAVIKIVVKDSSGKTYTIIHANGTLKSYTVDLSGTTLYLDTLGQTEALTAETVISPFQTLIVYTEA